MATPRWLGRAAAIAQVDSITVGGTVEAGDLFIVTINGKAVSTASTTTSTTTTATEVFTALAALSDTYYQEFGEITWTNPSAGVVRGTADTRGKPFTLTATTTEANGGAADAQTFTSAATTANSGPNVWSTAANWDTGAAPTTGDTFYVDNTDIDILYDLSQAGATVTAGHISMSFTGTIGLPKLNEDATAYPEYRTDYLTLDCSTWHIGTGVGPGSGRIKINSGTVQTAVNVYNTGSSLETNLEAFLWKGTHASNTFTARGNASCGVAVFGAETAVIATLTIDDNARVRCGPGTTLTTININNGELEVNSAIGGTLTMLAGKVTINLAATAAQLTLRGGECVYNSTGTISGNTIVAGDAVLDFSQAPGAVTVSNPIELYGPNCRVIDRNKRVASLVIDYNEGASVGQVDFGDNVRLTRGTPA